MISFEPLVRALRETVPDALRPASLSEVIEMIVDPGLGPLAPDVTEVDGKQMAEQMFEIIRSRLKFFG